MSAKKAETPRRGSGVWLQGLVCGALVTLATPTALLAGVLLLPTIIVYVIDNKQGRATLRAVLLFGLAGSVRPLLTLWTGSHTIETSLSLLYDIAVPVLAWSAQGAGWLLAQTIPLLFRVALEAQAKVEMVRLRAERAKLAEAWGLPPEPAGGGGDAAASP